VGNDIICVFVSQSPLVTHVQVHALNKLVKCLVYKNNDQQRFGVNFGGILRFFIVPTSVFPVYNVRNAACTSSERQPNSGENNVCTLNVRIDRSTECTYR